MCFLYSLSEKVELRAEKKGGILLFRNEEDNSLFFYIPTDFEIFEDMKKKGSFLEIDNKTLENPEMVKFLSRMIKMGILNYEKEARKECAGKKVVKLKKMPKMISLFITPTVHFRRYYNYGRR